MLRRHLDKILIGGGCILIAVALFLHFETKIKQERLLADYELMVANLQVEPDDDTEPVERPVVPEGVLGILSIPRIDLLVAVQEGVDQRTLNHAVGHFPQTALPGTRGNFSVIGHRNYARGQFFNRLGEVEVGDEILVQYLAEDYVYRVTDTFVVTPDQVSVLDEGTEAEITLVTCAPARRSTHRLIVKGLLVQQPPPGGAPE